MLKTKIGNMNNLAINLRSSRNEILVCQHHASLLLIEKCTRNRIVYGVSNSKIAHFVGRVV